jgi:hypothetical protein
MPICVDGRHIELRQAQLNVAAINANWQLLHH